MTDEKNDSGFTVKDKRIFTEGKEAIEKESSPSLFGENHSSPDSVHNEQSQDWNFDYPPINFTNFVLSLSTSALYHFGDFPDPTSGKAQKDLPAAKQTIDILNMISEKTKGNLAEQENELLQGVLYELRMRFVKENV